MKAKMGSAMQVCMWTCLAITRARRVDRAVITRMQSNCIRSIYSWLHLSTQSIIRNSKDAHSDKTTTCCWGRRCRRNASEPSTQMRTPSSRSKSQTSPPASSLSAERHPSLCSKILPATPTDWLSDRNQVFSSFSLTMSNKLHSYLRLIDSDLMW